MGAWGHTIRRLSDAEIVSRRARVNTYVGLWERDHAGQSYPYHREDACTSGGRCAEEATHEITYRYVTGRGGRVSHAVRFACDRHAAKCREKYAPVEVAARAPRTADVVWRAFTA